MKKHNIIKKIAIITLFLLLTIQNIVMAFTTNEFNFEVQNNSQGKEMEIYILLPKEYILHCIEEEKMELEYLGPETLKENKFESINVKPENIKEDIYEHEGQEFVQILLEPTAENEYSFNILETYTNMDIKYRITNEEKDYIIHIDNFEKKNGICKIIYDYDLNKVNQPTVKVVNVSTKIIIAIVIIVILLIIISIIKRGE